MTISGIAPKENPQHLVISQSARATLSIPVLGNALARYSQHWVSSYRQGSLLAVPCVSRGSSRPGAAFATLLGSERRAHFSGGGMAKKALTRELEARQRAIEYWVAGLIRVDVKEALRCGAITPNEARLGLSLGGQDAGTPNAMPRLGEI